MTVEELFNKVQAILKNNSQASINSFWLEIETPDGITLAFDVIAKNDEITGVTQTTSTTKVL